MKYKVVQTKQGKVGVDESADIKEQDYCDYPPFGIGQIKNIDNELCFVTIPIKSKGSLTQRLYQCKDECQKVIASINHSISLNVPMVIVEDDIDLGRIAKKEYLRILDNLKQEYLELETADFFTPNNDEYIHSTGAKGNYATHNRIIKTNRVNGQLIAYVKK